MGGIVDRFVVDRSTRIFVVSMLDLCLSMRILPHHRFLMSLDNLKIGYIKQNNLLLILIKTLIMPA